VQTATKPFYDLKASKNGGKELAFDSLQGKTVLVVNTASNCGFTPQYEGLQDLYRKYQDKGLEILGFPCDQFGHQEPGTDEQIREFCTANFGVTFPLFNKVDVNGPKAHPVYEYLTEALPGAIGKMIKWNFTKFLIDSEGNPVKRYAPSVTPEKLEKDIKSLLEKE